jgi:mono/diheme cytochrome c family protein
VRFVLTILAASGAAWLIVGLRHGSWPAGQAASPLARALTESERARAQHIAETNCAGCHGPGLTGAVAPSLVGIAARRSEQNIERILLRGKGRKKATPMPGGLGSSADAEVMAQWLLTR